MTDNASTHLLSLRKAFNLHVRAVAGFYELAAKYELDDILESLQMKTQIEIVGAQSGTAGIILSVESGTHPRRRKLIPKWIMTNVLSSLEEVDNAIDLIDQLIGAYQDAPREGVLADVIESSPGPLIREHDIPALIDTINAVKEVDNPALTSADA